MSTVANQRTEHDIVAIYQVGVLISQDIKTVDTASDWLVANLGTVNIGYQVNTGSFIDVLSKQLEKILVTYTMPRFFQAER